MRVSFKFTPAAALCVGLLLALSPVAVTAQVAEQEALQCVATVDPAGVPAGQAAFQITASLSEDIGEVAGFQSPDESGLALADPADIPRAELAAEEEVRPIEMTPETNTVSFWLSTAQAAPGTYEAQLTSEQGNCSVSVNVVEGA